MNYYRMVVDCWRFFRKYQAPVSADSYWKQMAVDAKHIAGKYGDCRFIKSLLLVMMDEIERIFYNGEVAGK